LTQTQPLSGTAPILPEEPTFTPVDPQIAMRNRAAEDEAKKKRKKKKAKKQFKANKKFQQLAKQWELVDKERAKETSEYKAKNEKKKNEKWVLEQSGRTAEDNPNLIKVGDWRSKVL